MNAVAARARRRPTASSGFGSVRGPMPAPCGGGGVSASRLVCRITSWFESTQVLGAPTPPNAASDSSTIARSGAAAHGVSR